MMTELDLYRDAVNSWASIGRAAMRALEDVDPLSRTLVVLRDAEAEVNGLMRRGLADLAATFDTHADEALDVANGARLDALIGGDIDAAVGS